MAESIDEYEGRAMFAKLKPLCVQVMSSPSLENLAELREGLSSILQSRPLHPHMVDYVLLPVRMVINKFGSSNLRLLEGGLDTLGVILSHTRGLDKWELFHSLLVYLCMLLDSKMAREAGFTDRSEDLVLVAVRALKELLLSPSKSVDQSFLSLYPAVGHCVSVLLETLQSFNSKTVRQVTFSALLALTGVDPDTITLTLNLKKDADMKTELDSEVEKGSMKISSSTLEVCVKYLDGLLHSLGTGPEGCGHVFAAFLPGISMAISKLITSDVNLGSSVTSLALLTWAHYVGMVMKGSECLIEAKSDDKTPQEADVNGRKLEVKRSLSWQQETDSKLCLLVQRMGGLVTSEGWRARLAVVGWAHVLLTHAYRTLTTSTPHIIESLVTLSHDDYPLISHAANHVITKFSDHYGNDQSDFKLTSLLEGRVHLLSSALPRLMRQSDDKRKVATLQLLAGYLRLLGPHTITFTHSHAHLSRLILALVQTLEVQVPDTRIMEHPLNTAALDNTDTNGAHDSKERLDDELHSNQMSSTSKWDRQAKLALRFVHFREERIEALLCNVCQLLGCHGDVQVVVDHMTDLYRSSLSQRKEVLIILSQVLMGARDTANRSTELPSLVKALVLELVETAVDGRGASRDLWEEETPSSQQDTALLSCLLLQTVLVCASVMETTFDPLLQQLAYPLMQWLGDSDPAVSSYARGVVHAVAKLCGYSSIQELITRNADYLVNSTALTLRSPSSLEQHLQATHVLQAILTHSDEKVLPLIRDSLDELLFSLDAKRQSPAHIWPTLHTLSDSCRCWSSTQPLLPKENSSNNGKIDKISNSPKEHVSPDDIRTFFLDYHKRKDSESDNKEGEEVSAGMPDDETPYDQRKKLPPVTRAAVDVMQRCTHHLSSPTQQVQLLTLEALANCIQALKNDQNTLLPEVHDVWSSFLPRLSDPSPPVAVRAWSVMLVMCGACGGFLRKRVVVKVWPPLVKSLESLAGKSLNTDNLYRQTVQYKLQQCLLSCAATLCVQLEVPMSNLETLARSSLPYLSRDQPSGLQDACVDCFKQLIGYDGDIVWLLLQQMCPEAVCTPPPRSELREYTFRIYKECEKYADNVRQLLVLCSEL